MCIIFKLFKFKKLVDDCRVATHLCTKCFTDLAEEEEYARRELERMGESVPNIFCRSFTSRDCGNYVRICFKLCEPMQYNLFKCCGSKCLDFDKDTELERLQALTGYNVDEGEEVYEVTGDKSRRLTLVNNEEPAGSVKAREVQSYNAGSPSERKGSAHPPQPRKQTYNPQPEARLSRANPNHHDYNPKYNTRNSNVEKHSSPATRSLHPSHADSQHMSRRGSRQMSRRGSRDVSQFSSRPSQTQPRRETYANNGSRSQTPVQRPISHTSKNKYQHLTPQQNDKYNNNTYHKMDQDRYKNSMTQKMVPARAN